MNKTWLVFWVRGWRVGSVENTPANRAEAAKRLGRVSRLIQRDVTGTEHWEVFARP
jgi:hypothetical protein